MKRSLWPTRDPVKDYFPLPKEIFSLGLSAAEIAIYAYLLFCEDRQTFQCWPSYRKISEAVGLSPNTICKHIRSLEERGLLVTEPTMVTTKDGCKRNGNLLFTIRPIQAALQQDYDRQMQKLDEDYVEELFMTNTHHYLMFFTNTGRVYRMKAYEIPEASRTARGTAIVNLLQLQPGEKITAVIPMRKYEKGHYLFMATKKGLVKKTPLEEYENVRKTGLAAIALRDDDELIEVKTTDNEKEIILVTKFGQCIRFKENDVRTTGRVSMGVRGINLLDGDEVVGMQICTQGDYLLVVSENGMGKRTPMAEFTVQLRGGKGVKCYKITEKTGNLIGSKAVNEDNEIMMITTEGIIIRTPCSGISVMGRITSGVKLMDVDGEIKVASIAKVRDKEASEETPVSEKENETASEKTQE